jgi:hypothetical protein
MDQCSDNSTACLLRAILHANSVYNWNPVSVGLTAAIGILALVIAFATVFQGVLAAGPGRLKSSQRAIGMWAKHTVTRMHWKEFRVRSTAFVPYLRYNELLQLLAAQVSTDQNNEQYVPYNFVAAHPAGWYVLLEELGLQTGSFKMLPCQTDYLPSDIQAAPVSGRVECIVLLAAIAGCDQIRMAENGYPWASGSHCQLTFRGHQQIGTVAVYETFPEPRTYGRNTKSRICSSIALAFGIFRFGGSAICILPEEQNKYQHGGIIVKSLQTRSQTCQHEVCSKQIPDGPLTNELALLLLSADPPLSARVFPAKKVNLHENLGILCGRNKGWIDDVAAVNTSIINLVQSHGGNVFRIEIDTLKQLPLCADRVPIDRGGGASQWILWLGTQSWAIGNVQPGQNDLGRPNWSSQIRVGPSDFVLVTVALSWCWEWRRNPKCILSLTYEEKEIVSVGVLFQLHEVDWWLRYCGQSDASCEASRLYWSTEITESAIGSMLVFRASLLAIILALAADYSIVSDTELGKRVVQML